MKKIMAVLFIIGMILTILDVDNMMIFFLSKVIGIIFMLPSLVYVYRTEEK